MTANSDPTAIDFDKTASMWA